MILAFAKLVSTLMFIGVAVPCLFFGILGLTGSLTDTSERENFHQGLMFVSAACIFAAPSIVWRVLPRSPRSVRP